MISDYELLKQTLNNPKINDRTSSLSTKLFGAHLIQYFTFINGIFDERSSRKLKRNSQKWLVKVLICMDFCITQLPNVICYNYTDVNFIKLMDLANRINDSLGAGGSQTRLPLLNLIPTKAKREIISLERPIRQFVNDIIVDHSNNFDSENISDFLDAYLYEQQLNDHLTKDDYSHLTDDSIRGSLTALLVAGAVTTSTVINWGILYLITNQVIQDRVQS